MFRSRGIALSIVGWFLVSGFWLFATRSFHPSWSLAIVVTSALMIAYASATYFNHLYLIPTYRDKGKTAIYASTLMLSMAGLTAAALVVIRISYLHVFGPYPVNHLGIDYAIDLFGMFVHVAIAMGVVKFFTQRIPLDAPS